MIKVSQYKTGEKGFPGRRKITGKDTEAQNTRRHAGQLQALQFYQQHIKLEKGSGRGQGSDQCVKSWRTLLDGRISCSLCS